MNSRLTELPNRCINHVATTSSIQPNDWTAHVLRNVVVDYRALNQSVISLSVTNYPSTWFKISISSKLIPPAKKRLSQSEIGVFPGVSHFHWHSTWPCFQIPLIGVCKSFWTEYLTPKKQFYVPWISTKWQRRRTSARLWLWKLSRGIAGDGLMSWGLVPNVTNHRGFHGFLLIGTKGDLSHSLWVMTVVAFDSGICRCVCVW